MLRSQESATVPIPMTDMPTFSPANAPDNLRPARNLALAVYALQVAGFFLGGIPTLIGVIINYVKRGDVQGTWLESHFRWQIRTFWFGLLWGVIGAVLVFVYVGVVILVANTVWMIYRIVKGWLYLNDNKPLYQD